MVSHGSPENYYDFLRKNSNSTAVGVIFCTSNWPIYENVFDLPC